MVARIRTHTTTQGQIGNSIITSVGLCFYSVSAFMANCNKGKKCLNGDLSQLVRDRREIPSNSSRHAPGKLMSLFARWNCAGQFRATGYLSIVAFYHELAFIAPMLFKS